MKVERIGAVEILDTGVLIVVLESGGDPSYQYVYREAAEVYWDNALSAFKSPPPRKWSQANWYQHIVSVAKNIGILLSLTENTKWVNVPDSVKMEILTEIGRE